MSGWDCQDLHNPAVHPLTTSPCFSIKQEVKAEDALRKHWVQAYKRTLWAVSNIQIEVETKRDFSYLLEWIGYSWHLCCEPGGTTATSPTLRRHPNQALGYQIDPDGSNFMIPPLPHDIGTWKGLEDMENKDIQLCEGQ